MPDQAGSDAGFISLCMVQELIRTLVGSGALSHEDAFAMLERTKREILSHKHPGFEQAVTAIEKLMNAYSDNTSSD